MHGTKEYDEEDHFEEDQENITFGQEKCDDAQDCAHRSLHNRQSQRVQCLAYSILWQLALRRHVNVANVSGEVN